MVQLYDENVRKKSYFEYYRSSRKFLDMLSNNNLIVLLKAKYLLIESEKI